MRRCIDCGQLLPETEFYRRTRDSPYFMSSCKACALARAKVYRQTDVYKQYQAEYQRSPRGKEVRRPSIARYENTEKGKAARARAEINYRLSGKKAAANALREQRPDVKAHRKEYHKSPFGKAARARDNARRRSAWESIERTLTKAEWDTIVAAYDGRCAYCGKMVEHPQMDHVVPLSRGGAHSKGNVVPACGRCNNQKHDRTPEEWGREVCH